MKRRGEEKGEGGRGGSFFFFDIHTTFQEQFGDAATSHEVVIVTA